MKTFEVGSIVVPEGCSREYQIRKQEVVAENIPRDWSYEVDGQLVPMLQNIILTESGLRLDSTTLELLSEI